MWWPSERAFIDAIVLAAIAGFLLQRGLVREGQPSLGKGNHTQASALVSNAVIGAVGLVALADVLRALWRGGALRRGERAQVRARALGGAEVTLGEIRLRRAEGILLRLACDGAASKVIAFSLVATSKESPNIALHEASSVHGDLAWEAQRFWTGVLRPPIEGGRLGLAVRLHGASTDWADVTVRWSPTLVLAWK